MYPCIVGADYVARHDLVPGDTFFMWIFWNTMSRTTLLLPDQSFTETVSAPGRYITFIHILFPAVFLMVGPMGFLVSWLMGGWSLPSCGDWVPPGSGYLPRSSWSRPRCVSLAVSAAARDFCSSGARRGTGR